MVNMFNTTALFKTRFLCSILLFSDLIEESACLDNTSIYYFPDKDDFTKFKACYPFGGLHDGNCDDGAVLVPREDFRSTACVAPADGQCAVNTSRPEGKITGISWCVVIENLVFAVLFRFISGSETYRTVWYRLQDDMI